MGSIVNIVAALLGLDGEKPPAEKPKKAKKSKKKEEPKQEPPRRGKQAKRRIPRARPQPKIEEEAPDGDA